MDAKELRIGNYINERILKTSVVKNIFGGGSNVVEVHKESDEANFSYTLVLSNVKGIHLTEEWLVKFGFEEGAISNSSYDFHIHFYDCWHINYKEKELFGDNEILLNGFWEVHQLQNLYFALTGEELEIKE